MHPGDTLRLLRKNHEPFQLLGERPHDDPVDVIDGDRGGGSALLLRRNASAICALFLAILSCSTMGPRLAKGTVAL